MKLPNKAWLKSTLKIYAGFSLLLGLISATLMAIKTALHGFDKVYLEIIFNLTFISPALVTAIFCLPTLIFGKFDDS